MKSPYTDSLAHTTWKCKYHIVFAPKYRRKEIYGTLKREIGMILRELCRRKDVEVINAEACPDHIHLFVSIPPKYSVSSIVRLIKSNLGRELKQKFPFLKKCYYGTDGIWSDGYLASAVGINEKVVRKYIERQGKEDMGRTMKLFE